MKNDFIANISHEIKTPLSVIQFYTNALQNSAMREEERKEYIKTILEATQKLSTLVTNILKLSKLENQEIIGDAAIFDLSEQLRRCALSFADQMEQKNIRFEEDLDEASICNNADMLDIIWNNLFSNAIKFTNSGGSISMSLKVQNDSSLSVSITDSGCGMDKTTKKRIFDKFYQGDTPHAKEGNGLGLALVKKAVDLLNGTITVESIPGQGATFTVTLQMDRCTLSI
jgi:signal transduction histidine kinase